MMRGNGFLSRRTVTIRHVISSDMVCQYYTRCSLVLWLSCWARKPLFVFCHQSFCLGKINNFSQPPNSKSISTNSEEDCVVVWEQCCFSAVQHWHWHWHRQRWSWHERVRSESL